MVYIFVCSQDRSHSLLQSVPLSEVEGEWGRGTDMRGLLSSFCLFTDHLSPSAIRTLYTRGIYSSAKFYERIYTEHETPLGLYLYFPHFKAPNFPWSFIVLCSPATVKVFKIGVGQPVLPSTCHKAQRYFCCGVCRGTILFALSPGPNDLSLFQPKCPETREMGSRLLVYYHAKACRDTVCMNLSPSPFASPDSSMDGHFTGQYYVTRDVKVHMTHYSCRGRYKVFLFSIRIYLYNIAFSLHCSAS